MKILIFSLLPFMVLGNVTLIKISSEDRRINLLVDLMVFNLKHNGWNTIYTYGSLPDSFYNKIKRLPFTFVTSNNDKDDLLIEDVVPYHPNIVLIECTNFTNFEQNLRKVMHSPYFYPPSCFIILYHLQADKHEIVKVLYILWFYRITKGIVIQHDDTKNVMYISEFNPFVVGVTANTFGCRSSRPVGMPINNFGTSFVCEYNCENVTSTSKNRHLRLGTCMELKTHTTNYDDRKELLKLNLFKDKGSNMNGFGLRTLTTEVFPFLNISDLGNGTFKFGSRDGSIWTNLAKLMNFTIDLTPSLKLLRQFNFKVNIPQVFSVAQRKGDLFLIPVYQFDVIIVNIDFSFAYKDSGVCFISHKALLKTVLFDLTTLEANIDVVMQFFGCLSCICVVLFLYSSMEAEKITSDLLGKSFMNMVRSSLSVTLHHPPKQQLFRIFHLIILWSFFIINFSTQAAFVSFFTAYKRGPEVETFADIVKTGYRIQGVSSPDLVLPDDNELFRKINSRLEPIDYMYSCVEHLAEDLERFCLLDCSVAKHMSLHKLNSKGEQYMHLAKDRIHNYYLSFVFPKYSVLTESVDKYLIIFFEAGLIQKWEQFRYKDIKEESTFKALGMRECQGIFNVYFAACIFTFSIFLLEVLIVKFIKISEYLKLRVRKWKSTLAARKFLRLEWKENNYL